MKKDTLLLVIFFIFSYTSAHQKADSTKFQNLKDGYKKETAATYSIYESLDTLGKRNAELNREEFITNVASEKLKRMQIEEENFAIKHRWRSYDFQYTASIIIFIIVIIIVISGLVFSGWQFSYALRQMKLKEKIVDRAVSTAPTELDNQVNNLDWAALSSQLEVSATGIKVNSSLLGVIILALSIAFFYLYIIYVYPIKYIATPATTEIVENAKASEKPRE